MNKLIAIFIGANSDAIFGINEAKRFGFYTIAFDGNSNADGLKFVDKAVNIDIKEPKLIIKHLRSINIIPDIIVPTPLGRYLITIGTLNDYYHLMGVTFKMANLCTDKYIFHELLKKNDLRPIDCMLVKRETKIDNGFPFRYPVIIKPRFGSGSRSVFVVNSYEELKKQFVDYMPFEEDFLIEELKYGIEYGVDGAVINGKFCFILLREKIVTAYPYRQCIGYYSVIKSEDNSIMFQQIQVYMQKIIEAMCLNNVLLHADLIYNDHDPFLIEISARPSGHNLHNLFTPLATGINMVGEYIKYLVPNLNQVYSFSPIFTECMVIRYFNFENYKVIGVPDETELFKRYPLVLFKCNCLGKVMEKVVDGPPLMQRGYFILEGKSKTELEIMSNALLNEFVLEKV